MAPRHATIVRLVEKAIAQIEADRCANALRSLESLLLRLNNKDSTPKKPNAYAKFVKDKFPGFQLSNPQLNATEIMPLIAKEWKAQKAKNAV